MSEARKLVDRRLEGDLVLELFRRETAWDVDIDGRRAMSTDRRGSERSLVELTLAPWQGRDDISVLLGGLGMGFTLRAVLDTPGVSRVDVVEISPAILSWEASYFAELNQGAARDPRVTIHQAELAAFLAPGTASLPVPGGWFACILDLDEWPTLVSLPGNRALYEQAGLELLESALRPGGVLGLWTSQRDDRLLERLTSRLTSVTKVAVPVELDGAARLDFVYRGRRGPRRTIN
jgi:spermidine synthase